MKFTEGEKVLAKMPSSGDYERATVVDARGGKYKVQFKGGIEHTLGENDLKAQRTSRSQTRTKGRPPKSSSRTSPSRRSPARKSPARSPSQGRKLPVRNAAKQAKISLARIDVPKDNSSDTDRTEGSESVKDEYEPPKSRLRELGPITRRSIRIMSNASKAEHDQKLAALRGTDRAASLPVEKKYDASSEGKERGLSMQPSDDKLKMMHYEESTDTGSDSKNKDINLISKPQEWGGWFGALLLILAVPLYTLLLQLACTFDNCSSKNFRSLKKYNWKSFFNLEAFLLHGGLLCFVAIISLLPIGRLIDGQQSKIGRLQYRINGIWALFLTIAAFKGCKYQDYKIDDFILKKSLPLSVAGLIYGVIIALILYIKAGRVPVSNLNMYGSTNNKIYDFWQGREVNPRIGPLDVKITLFRFAAIATIIINLAALSKIVEESAYDWHNVDYVAVLAAILQMVYAFDNLLFEAAFTTTFEVLYEGTGYMLSVGYLVRPFIATITIRYLLQHRIEISLVLINVLCFITLCYVIGYLIYRISNSTKDKFRNNPFDPFVSSLESIPTKRGKRLIVSGLWGFVRHPNYLGDIIMHWSICCLSLSTDVLPYVLAIHTTLLLIYRAKRDNARCEKRYGYAWEQYCSRVKYMILRRVF